MCRYDSTSVIVASITSLASYYVDYWIMKSDILLFQATDAELVDELLPFDIMELQVV